MSLKQLLAGRRDQAALKAGASAEPAEPEQDETAPAEPEKDAPPAAGGKKEGAGEAAAAATAAAAIAAPPATAAADPAAVIEHCLAEGVPQLAAGLIRQKATMDQVKERVAGAAKIRAKVAEAARLGFSAAGQKHVAALGDKYIAEGLGAQAFGEAVLELLADGAGPDFRNTVDADASLAPTKAWDKVVAAYNDRH